MNNETRDPKPWKCTNCFDRFVHNQTGNLIHFTIFAPRESYTQNYSDYSS